MSQQENQKKLEFAKRVISLRRRMNLSQVQFGKELGVSDEYVSQIEKAKKLPGEGLQILVGTLEAKFQQSSDAVSNSVESGVEIHEAPPEYQTVKECKQRIQQLEDDNERLRAMVLAAAAPRVSSAPPLSEAQSIAKQSGDEHDKNRKK